MLDVLFFLFEGFNLDGRAFILEDNQAAFREHPWDRLRTLEDTKAHVLFIVIGLIPLTQVLVSHLHNKQLLNFPELQEKRLKVLFSQ